MPGHVSALSTEPPLLLDAALLLEDELLDAELLLDAEVLLEDDEPAPPLPPLPDDDELLELLALLLQMQGSHFEPSAAQTCAPGEPSMHVQASCFPGAQTIAFPPPDVELLVASPHPPSPPAPLLPLLLDWVPSAHVAVMSKAKISNRGFERKGHLRRVERRGSHTWRRMSSVHSEETEILGGVCRSSRTRVSEYGVKTKGSMGSSSSHAANLGVGTTPPAGSTSAINEVAEKSLYSRLRSW